MKIIKLTKGLSVKVDDADYNYLNSFKWYALKPTGNKKHYAARAVTINGKRTTQYMHKVLLNTNLYVDHIDRDTLNNQRVNLRVATPSQSRCNSTAKGKSKYLGVIVVKGKYYALISVNGNKINLGGYINEIDAAKAYNDAAAKYHGEFANLNII